MEDAIAFRAPLPDGSRGDAWFVQNAAVSGPTRTPSKTPTEGSIGTPQPSR